MTPHKDSFPDPRPPALTPPQPPALAGPLQVFNPHAAGIDISLLKHGTASVQQGMEEYEAQYRERKVKAMARQAKAFGSTLVPLAV